MNFRGSLTLVLSAALSVALAPAGGNATTYNMTVQSVPEAGGKCVSVPNGPFVEGMRVLLWDCNNMLAQTLVYDDQTQQLKFGANCVEVLGQGRAQDAIGVGTCNGAVTQRWNMVPDKDNYLIVGVNGLCLDISNGVPANGTPLDVAPCTLNNVVELWALYQASDTAAVQSQPAPTSNGAGAAAVQSQPAPTSNGAGAAPLQSQPATPSSAAGAVPPQPQPATPSSAAGAAPLQPQPATPSSAAGTAAVQSAAVQGTGPAMPDSCQQNLDRCSQKIWAHNSFPHRGYRQSVKFSNGMTLTCTSNGPDTPRSCTLN